MPGRVAVGFDRTGARVGSDGGIRDQPRAGFRVARQGQAVARGQAGQADAGNCWAGVFQSERQLVGVERGTNRDVCGDSGSAVLGAAPVDRYIESSPRVADDLDLPIDKRRSRYPASGFPGAFRARYFHHHIEPGKGVRKRSRVRERERATGVPRDGAVGHSGWGRIGGYLRGAVRRCLHAHVEKVAGAASCGWVDGSGPGSDFSVSRESGAGDVGAFVRPC